MRNPHSSSGHVCDPGFSSTEGVGSLEVNPFLRLRFPGSESSVTDSMIWRALRVVPLGVDSVDKGASLFVRVVLISTNFIGLKPGDSAAVRSITSAGGVVG